MLMSHILYRKFLLLNMQVRRRGGAKNDGFSGWEGEGGEGGEGGEEGEGGVDIGKNPSHTPSLLPLPPSPTETKAVGEKLYQTHATKIRHALLRSAPIYGKEDPILIAPLLRGEVPFLPAGGERQW